MWNLQRIHAHGELKKEYGLKNMKELWKVQSNMSRIRGNVRELLSGGAQNPIIEQNIKASLARLSIVQGDANLDNLLELHENAFLERRLQSIVFRKGMARSMKQSRQLITHGFISINGRKVSRPGYMVSVDDEKSITYHRPIDVNANIQPKEAKATVAAAEPAQQEEVKGQ